MCGIAGILAPGARHGRDRLGADAARMGEALVHRGPDAGAEWVDEGAGLAFAHRRLAIIDLSPAGAQPMVSASGRFVICYNGEVYNAAEISAVLAPRLAEEGVALRGHSDTEVILEAAERFGVRGACERLIGMFAFALWDRRARELWLVRDRLGIKPLYWTRDAAARGGPVLFGSELKALRAHPEAPGEIDRDAVAGYLRHNYIAAPRSIYRGIEKLAPGTIVRLDAHGRLLSEERYWSLDSVVAQGAADRFDGSDEDAVDELERILGDAVGRRMIADVPLGAFLSGGVDSSTIVALMQARASRPVRSYSIGFHEAGFNEAVHAKAVAAHLGADHTELYVTSAEARAVIPDLPRFYDEPFADSSQIPTVLLSRMTRQHVTVALSGDGGDELFAGYERYVLANRIANATGMAPRFARRILARAMLSVQTTGWDRLFRLAPGAMRPARAGEKAHKLARVLSEDGDAVYRRLLSHWQTPDELVIGGTEPRGALWDEALASRIPNFIDRMRYLDTVTYLPDDILVKVDRASMAVGLEARVPLLDHRVVAFAWRLPRRLLLGRDGGKQVLKQLLYRYVPKALVDRPKMGFGVPLDAWLRGPLKDWAGDLLSPSALKRDGLLQAAPIERAWAEHLSGAQDWHYALWDVLMLQAWRLENRM